VADVVFPLSRRQDQVDLPREVADVRFAGQFGDSPCCDHFKLLKDLERGEL
jgi:hypothetical protein